MRHARVEKRGKCRVLLWKPEGRKPLGRPQRKWEDNIKVYFKNRVKILYWFGLAQDRDRWRAIVNAVMDIGVQ